MEKFKLVALCILGAAVLILVVGLAVTSWAVNQIEKEEQQQIQNDAMYILRDGVIFEEHDVSGLIDED